MVASKHKSLTKGSSFVCPWNTLRAEPRGSRHREERQNMIQGPGRGPEQINFLPTERLPGAHLGMRTRQVDKWPKRVIPYVVPANRMNGRDTK